MNRKKNGTKRRKQEERERKISRAVAAAAIILILFFFQFNIKEYNKERVEQEMRRNNQSDFRWVTEQHRHFLAIVVERPFSFLFFFPLLIVEPKKLQQECSKRRISKMHTRFLIELSQLNKEKKEEKKRRRTIEVFYFLEQFNSINVIIIIIIMITSITTTIYKYPFHIFFNKPYLLPLSNCVKTDIFSHTYLLVFFSIQTCALEFNFYAQKKVILCLASFFLQTR